MSTKYNSQRKRNIFSLFSNKPFEISRSKIEDYMECPRCFYIDRKCGTKQPPSFPYTLNNAVDTLLKKEFDQYRLQAKQHPILAEHGIEAIPFSHPDLNQWRQNLVGIKYFHEPLNLIISGAVDDVWIKSDGELIIVDFKATSIKNDVSLEGRDYYKRQMEIYQWLFRKNGFKVSNTGYFLCCNGDSSQENFKSQLTFKISLLPYEGNDEWIESTLFDIKSCLENDELPDSGKNCNYCPYVNAASKHIEKCQILSTKSKWVKLFNKSLTQLMNLF